MRGGRILGHASSVLVLEVDGVSGGASVDGGEEGYLRLFARSQWFSVVNQSPFFC